MLFVDGTTHAVDTIPDFQERGVDGCKPEADVIGFAEVGDQVHFLDEGAIDAVALCVAQTYV